MNRFYCSLSILLLLAHALYSQPGSLDPTFGINGKLKWSSDNPVLSKAIALPNGKILTCAREEEANSQLNIILRRFTNTGMPDIDFGNDSYLKLDFSGFSSGSPVSVYPLDMKLTPEGKILVAGNINRHNLNNPDSLDAFVACLTIDGIFDTTFGTEGIVIFDNKDRIDNGAALGIFPDGAFVLWFLSHYANTPVECGLVKFLSNGTIDPDFGQSGVQNLTNIVLNPGWLHLGVHKNDKIVLAGHLDAHTNYYQFNPDGTPDTGFGQNGHVLADHSNSLEQIRDVKTSADGKIVASGYAFLSGNVVFLISRLMPDGRSDSTFHQVGFILDPLADFDCETYSLLIQSDGKMIVSGYGILGFEQDWLIARYLNNGNLDSSFGSDGVIHTDFGGDNEGAYWSTLDYEHKLLAFGQAGSDYAFARYELGPDASAVNESNAAFPFQAQIRPNPLSRNEVLSLQVSVFKPGKCIAEILSLEGQLMQEFRFETITEGDHKQGLQINPSIPAGLYIVRLNTPDGIRVLKFARS